MQIPRHYHARRRRQAIGLMSLALWEFFWEWGSQTGAPPPAITSGGPVVWPRHVFEVGFGGATQWVHFTGVTQSSILENVIDAARDPISVPMTIANLVIGVRSDTSNPLTVTLYKNGVATLLSATAGTGVAVPVADTVHTVTGLPGDDFCWKFVSANGPGYETSICCEMTTDSVTSSTYSIVMPGGFRAANSTWGGGALGNGILTGGPVSFPTQSYSICAVPGTFNRIDCKMLTGTGSFTAYLVKNQIKQDGTGGTVNTATLITGNGVLANTNSAFNLHVVPTDHIEFEIDRGNTDGAALAAGEPYIMVSCGFTPDTAGAYHLSGGNNNTIGGTNNFHWTLSLQNTATESLANAVVSPTGITMTALYVERSAGPSYADHVLRRTGTSTGIHVLLNGPTSGSGVGNEPFNYLDTIDMMTSPFGLGGGGQFHWGAAALSLITTQQPTQVGCPQSRPLGI